MFFSAFAFYLCIPLLVLHLFEHLLCEVYKTHLWMGSYGGDTPKPTFIYHSHAWMSALSIELPQREWPGAKDMVTRC